MGWVAVLHLDIRLNVTEKGAEATRVWLGSLKRNDPEQDGSDGSRARVRVLLAHTAVLRCSRSCSPHPNQRTRVCRYSFATTTSIRPSGCSKRRCSGKASSAR